MGEIQYPIVRYKMLKAEYTLSTTPSGDEIKGQYEEEFEKAQENYDVIKDE